jgi:hypothetical protein
MAWQITGDYFENCNCDVVCPCLFSPNPPLTSQPTAGACEVAFGFHIDHGNYNATPLDGLNVALIARTPGPMAQGNWSVALYLDERANQQQSQGLQAIFTGADGGPMSALAPLISTVLGAKAVPINFQKQGKRRSVEIPNIMQLAVHAVPSLNPDHEIWAQNAHPFAPSVSMAVGEEHSTWTDYGMHWDNSGKNGHYAPISWSNA